MKHRYTIFLSIMILLLVAGCSTMGGSDKAAVTPRKAVPAKATIATCADLTKSFQYPNATLTSATVVPAGTLRIPGIAEPMPEHCLVKGKMNERKSAVDGKTYAIGFEMRLPTKWSGRFFYQGNGGLDGNVVNAYGDLICGGAPSNGLLKGFAVISSNAGHQMEQGPIGGGIFGIDPQTPPPIGPFSI